MLNIKYNNLNEIEITVYTKDIELIDSIKSIYDIEIIDYQGLKKIKKTINYHKYIIIFMLFCLLIIYVLSNMIFSIDIITNDDKMKQLIYSELKHNGLSKYKFKKNYQELQIIKKNILSKYKHQIDWIEIENKGTKYIVRYEPRIENKKNKTYPYRDIVAKKKAIIYKLDIKNGEIIKDKGDFVNKGDIIVSGYIHLNDEIKDTVSSSGKVYGEVWYKLNIKYPLNYYKEYKTNNKKNVYVFKLLNKDIELFNFHKYKHKDIKNKTLLKNNLLPFKLINQKQYEIKVIDTKYNEKQALKRSIKEGKRKLKKKGKIINYKVLEKKVNNNVLTTTIFYIVCEDITEYKTIEKYNSELNEINH